MCEIEEEISGFVEQAAVKSRDMPRQMQAFQLHVRGLVRAPSPGHVENDDESW